mgnify:CR=1 FL=1
MGRKRKNSLPFDDRGGKITVCCALIKSTNYQTLSTNSRALMTLLQLHWRNDKLVDYGVREAASKLQCDEKTARKAFNQLQDRDFVVCEEHSVFNSRLGSKSRSWRLTWLPFNYNSPTNDWEKWRD